MFGIEIAKETITLLNCPIGLFMSMDNELCLKTEYDMDAYIVSSGEKFWGGAKNKEELKNILVYPCSLIQNVVKVGCVNKVYAKDNIKIEDIVNEFELNFVYKNDRTIIYENKKCRFSFDNFVIRVLVYDGLDKELLRRLDDYFCLK